MQHLQDSNISIWVSKNENAFNKTYAIAMLRLQTLMAEPWGQTAYSNPSS